MELLQFLLSVYLFAALPPVVVAWRRGLPASVIRRTAFWGVLLGWTVLGAAWAWALALLSERTPDATVRISARVTLR